MLAIERKQQILDLLARERRVVVTELSERFGVTEETVRRDLHKLEREGLIERTHGGAVARQADAEDIPYPVRQTINLTAKRRVAANAHRFIRDGDAVMIDSSSTAFEMLPYLKAYRDLTLITNSVRLLAVPEVTSHTIMSTGGELRQQSLTFTGPLAIQALARFNADIAFISCKGLSLKAGITDASVADAEIKRAFIASARRVCLLVDGDKFDRTGLIGVGPIETISAVVTDRCPPDAWIELLANRAVELVH